MTDLLARHGTPSDAPNAAADAPPAPDLTRTVGKSLPAAGGALYSHFSDGQKVALLKMRRSDWSDAVLDHLRAFGRDDCSGEDYRALARVRLAIKNPRGFHELTISGKAVANVIAVQLARQEGLHAVTVDLHRSGAPGARCTCGWATYRTRAIPSFLTMLYRDAAYHLQCVGAMP